MSQLQKHQAPISALSALSETPVTELPFPQMRDLSSPGHWKVKTTEK